MLRRSSLIPLITVLLAEVAVAQAAKPRPVPARVDARKQFVLDVVQRAVALPESDPQDRLRVLSAAANVVSPVEPKMAAQLSREGIALESELIRAGQRPVASMFNAGKVDCAAAAHFVESLPADSVALAEQSLLGAISNCPTQVRETARQKLEAAMRQGSVAPRALLALMESSGVRSAWSLAQFRALFDSLPKDYEKAAPEAANFAAIYVAMSEAVDGDTAAKTGVAFLSWLSRLPASSERSMAINMTVDAMKKALGEDKYAEALRSDIVAAGVARNPGDQQRGIEHPEADSVSVLGAMQNAGRDETDALASMSPSMRARQAAADGFASSSSDRKLGDRYFDIAFAALDELWKDREHHPEAPAVVEEVSGAAAQVDPVAALTRAQHLDAAAAQAIGMIAVARVMLGKPAVPSTQ